MTTVAYRDGCLATDSQTTVDNHVGGFYMVKKIFESDEAVMACSGAYPDLRLFIEWFIDGMNEDEIPEFPDEPECRAIIIRKKDGAVLYCNEDCIPFEIDCEYYAIGTGNTIAIGAMAMGATAEEAIHAAIKHDVFTGGEVKTWRLGNG